jgi:hypothetical protein
MPYYATMRKIIQNYSILIFPILVGVIIILFWKGKKEFDHVVLHMIVLDIMSTLIALPPLLRLSNGKPCYARFLFGVASSFLIYVVAFLLSFIEEKVIRGEITDLFYGAWNLIQLTGIMAVVFLVVFFPFTISVIICFLLNDLYAKKMEKIINHFGKD